MATTITYTNHNNGYNSLYYNHSTFGEPRQRMWAVMRFEKTGASDTPGWYIKKITNDQNELKIWAKQVIDFPSTDGLGWVSNINDVMIVEIIPTDTVYKTI